jgi:hypothetical protein
MELHVLDFNNNENNQFNFTNETILSLLFFAQSALPSQLISSNLAEVFNS